MSLEQITAALTLAQRRNRAVKAQQIAAALQLGHLGQPAQVTAAYAAMVRAQVAILGVVVEQQRR